MTGAVMQSVSIEEARARMAEFVQEVAIEQVALSAARGRICASAIRAPRPLPSFDSSAMDGFAVRSRDTQTPSDETQLSVIASVFAGDGGPLVVECGQACRVMTGAPIPQGADAVVPFEQAVTGDGWVRVRRTEAGRHVRRQGEDYREGDVALAAGRRLGPAEMALCAAFGMQTAPVSRRPRVGVLSTGSELVAVGHATGTGQIVNTNGVAIAAMLEAVGAEPVSLGISRDDERELVDAFSQVDGLDGLVSTGGVSAGDRDLVHEVLAELCEVHHRFTVAMKPGKPFAFATRRDKPIFALAGNPAAAMVAFHQLVAPFVRRMLRLPPASHAPVWARLQGEVSGAKDKVTFIRARTHYTNGELTVRALPHQGAGSLRSMVDVNALIVLRPPEPQKPDGALVEVELLNYVAA